MATLNRAECASALKTGRLTDFVVNCGSISFDVHRFMLSISSGYFAAMLRNGFLEVIESKASIKDIDASVMAQVLDFIYLGDYTTKAPVIRYCSNLDGQADRLAARFEMCGPKERNDILEYHIHMYLAADRLLVEKLRVEAMRRVRAVLELEMRRSPLIERPSSDVLSFLFECTAPDNELRYHVLKFLVTDLNLRTSVSIKGVLEKYEPMAYKLAVELI